MIEEIIFNELKRLRDRLKADSKKSDVVIISDENIKKIATELPTSLASFKEVSALEDRYVELFYRHYKNILSNKERFITLNKQTKKTLEELEKKLVNISRRNRMLYFPKMPTTAYDMCDYTNEPFDLLFRGKSFKYDAKASGYKQINTVYRESQKVLRERGVMDLFIAYPFIKGKMADDFEIYAPLALFPVRLEKNLDCLTLRLDKTRDIVYNNNLLLANYKLNDFNKPLPNYIIENLNEESFLENLIDFYAEENINFYALHKTLLPYTALRENELKFYRNGDYSLEAAAVLGRFSSYSTTLEHDFKMILNEDVSTNILNQLLDKKEITTSNIIDEEISYVGELNSSQENVIRAIRTKDTVVVEGPPGTGKSQTITSLITNFALDDKSVLLVSEKKAALDVVYSRLGSLNRYALQIDDTNDKEFFYKQIKNMLEFDYDLEVPSNDSTKEIDEKISNYINRFKNIEDTFYKKGYLGIPYYQLYLECKSYDLENIKDKERLGLLNNYLTKYNFTDFKYDEIINAHKRFSVVDYLDKLLLYKRYEDTYLNYLKTDLSEYKVVEMRKSLANLSDEIKIYNSKNSFSKTFTSNNVKKLAKDFMNEFYLDNSRENLKILLNSKIDLDILRDYTAFVVAKDIFKRLNPVEVLYLDALETVIKYVEPNLTKANDELKNYIFYSIILNYENEHLDALNDIRNYNQIITSLDACFKEKKNITYDLVNYKLGKRINDNLKSGNRAVEINHSTYTDKRRLSVIRYISKYFDELNNGIRIWLLTPETVSEIFPLFSKSFDLVIFDEASQLYIEKSIPTIFRANKLVVAGDSKQLRPSSLGSGRLEYDFDEYAEDNIALEEESLLELAKYKFLPSMILNFHYRSRFEELIAFSNSAFYNDNLYVSPNVNNLEEMPINVYKINNGLWDNRSNLPEAKKVVEVLKNLLKNRKNKETIGIITFNSQQRDVIEDLIDHEAHNDASFGALIKEEFNRKSNGEDIGLFVKNIENVQGDERDIIIFSIGYAKNSDGKLIHNFGWLNQKGGENRLNVAITRAKQKVVVVTSINPYDLKVEKTSGNGPTLLKHYLEYCFAVSNNKLDLAKETIRQLTSLDNKERYVEEIVKNVYKAVSKRGFTVLSNVGIGPYSMDIVIKQGDKYILGIEFDTKLYNNNADTRERDYFRNKYLSSRGWNIYRVWCISWWHSHNEEVKRIMDKLASICEKNDYEI